MEEKRKRIVNKGQRSGSGRRKRRRRRRREMRRTLVEAALEVLNEGDPVVKAQLGEEIANQWVQGQIPVPDCFSDSQTVEHQVQKQVPDRPARLPIEVINVVFMAKSLDIPAVVLEAFLSKPRQ